MSNFVQNSSLGTAGTVTALAADITVAAHILTVGAAALAPLPAVSKYDVRQIESASLIAAVAETASVWTITPTFAASQEFSLQITQVINGTARIFVATAYTAASGGSITTLCDALVSVINAQASFKVTGARVGSTVTVTSQTGYPLVRVSQVSLSSTPGAFASITNTTPGVQAKGTYAALVASGVSADILVAGQSYSNFRIVYRNPSVNDAGGNVSIRRVTSNVYINAAATNYAALATRIGEIINGYGAGGTTADPEFLDIGA